MIALRRSVEVQRKRAIGTDMWQQACMMRAGHAALASFEVAAQATNACHQYFHYVLR